MPKTLLPKYAGTWTPDLHLIFFLSLLLVTNTTLAQELKCDVQVNAEKVQNVNPQVFKTFEKTVNEFMNNRSWTDAQFAPEERIECSMLINITEEVSTGTYKANVTIQSSRPVYNSGYNTVMLNYVDKDWVFDYTQYQSIEFNKNTFLSNLSSMLAYWSYMIIGLDYDSFSKMGGSPYFSQAQTIVNNVPSNLSGGKSKGWKPFDSDQNRYWFVEHMQNNKFKAIRNVYYQYHRKGLDLMYDDAKKGRDNILNTLKSLESMAKSYPNNMLLQLFFMAKSDELVGVFSEAPAPKKAAAVQLLYRIDPNNANKYSKMMKNK